MKKPYEIPPSGKGVLPASDEWTKGASALSRGVPTYGTSGEQTFGRPYDLARAVPTYGGATVHRMGKQAKSYEIPPAPGSTYGGLGKPTGCGGGCGCDGGCGGAKKTSSMSERILSAGFPDPNVIYSPNLGDFLNPLQDPVFAEIPSGDGPTGDACAWARDRLRRARKRQTNAYQAVQGYTAAIESCRSGRPIDNSAICTLILTYMYTPCLGKGTRLNCDGYRAINEALTACNTMRPVPPMFCGDLERGLAGAQSDLEMATAEVGLASGSLMQCENAGSGPDSLGQLGGLGGCNLFCGLQYEYRVHACRNDATYIYTEPGLPPIRRVDVGAFNRCVARAEESRRTCLTSCSNATWGLF